jgi:aspartate-semialdehyde dehydrogenase
MIKKYNIAIVGATGNTGREILNILSEDILPVGEIFAIASRDSIGKQVSFGDKNLNIISLDEFDFSKIDIAFFCAGSEISKMKALEVANSGCIVIDKSSYFRMNENIPLIVPEVNSSELNNVRKNSIIASPNCCTIPIAVALKPLDNVTKIKRLVINTYQSVSGAGTKAMDELYNQTKAKYVFQDTKNIIFPKQIAFNIIPQIGDFHENGYSSEELKISAELSKILGHHIKSTVTCVRVPVFVSHAISINIEFEKDLDAKAASEILSEADGIVVISSDNQMNYVTPIDTVGEDFVYISRIRNDLQNANSINMWIVCDNLRKGASLNSVQIAKELINKNII